MDALTPTELAVKLWGTSENDSHSHGAREIRRIARALFPGDAPGMGGKWELTPEMVEAVRSVVHGKT